MATIAENLKTIKDSTEAIKSAILEKGGTIEGNLTTYASAIANLPSGGGDPNPTASKNAVTFYDYDGSILYSYTAEEFLALSEMPPLPTQKGLICQEWNWSHEDAREYVAEYGILDVGATYITDDGHTRLYIRIASAGRMDVPLYFQQTIANGVTIDWGDGSATETLDGTGNVNTTHRYASIGDYMISLDAAEGCTLTLGQNVTGNCVLGEYSTTSNTVYRTMLMRVELGNAVSSISVNTFRSCTSLRNVTIHNNVKSFSNYVFRDCTMLYCLLLPKSITALNSNMLEGCDSLSLLSCSNSISLFNNAIFSACKNLTSITLPPLNKTLNTNMFSACSSLASIIIPKNINYIAGGTFNNCYGMAYYDFSHLTAVPTLSNSNAFTGILTDCKIIVPDALYDEWVAATNWSTYAANIIKKSDWDNQQ